MTIGTLFARHRPNRNFDETTMIDRIKDWIERQRRVCADADELIRLYGSNAYEKARERAGRIHPGTRDPADYYWDGVRREIGRRDFVAVARCLTW